MSTLVKSLKKQNELLAAEVELYAGGLDRLAGELADALTKLAAYEKSHEVDTAPMVPAGQSIDASKIEAKSITVTAPKKARASESVDLAD